LNKTLGANSTIYLPNDTGPGNQQGSLFYYQLTYFGKQKYAGTNDPVRHWWIKKVDSDYYNKDIDDTYRARKYNETPSAANGWTEIATTTTNSPSIPYTFQNGKWDLAFTIDSVEPSLNMSYRNQKQTNESGIHYYSPDVTAYQPYRLSAMLDRRMIEETLDGYLTYDDSKNFRAFLFLNYIPHMKPYKYMYCGIEVGLKTVKPFDAVHMYEMDNSKFSAIRHVLNCVQPVYGYGATTFTIDPAIRKQLSQVICPELTYEHGKSLFEILLDLGRLFLGIPRLLKNNVITFDILTNLLKDNSDELSDSTEKQSSESDISNHTTGFISNLSNIIPSNSWDRYPAGNLWISARSQNANDPYITRDNMAIVLPKKIYKILDVQILRDDSSLPISIKDYVFEKTVYDTMKYFTSEEEDSANYVVGKNQALYWKRGDNKIMGLGIIPDASKAYSLIGWKDTDYTINHILKAAAGNAGDPNKTINYKYAVWYIPYGSTQTYVEQSNLRDLSNSSYLNLNQENNTINDESFGQSAQTQADRLGNNSISKVFRSKYLSDIPTTGRYRIFNGSKYYIDQLNVQFNNSYYEVSEVFSKNWNKINERVGLNSEYRQYEITASDYVYRDISFNNYCYLSLNKYEERSSMYSKFTNGQVIKDINAAFNGAPELKKSIFYVACYEKGLNLKYTENKIINGEATSVTRKVEGLVLPATYYTYKNSFQYIGSMKDNYSAGEYGINTRVSGDVNNVLQQDARYTDSAGHCPFMAVALSNMLSSQLTLTNDEIENFGFTDAKTRASDLSNSLPLARHIGATDNLSGCIMSSYINVDKDMREAIRFNYQMHFLTYDKDITIHSGIVRNIYHNDFSYSGGAYSNPTKPIYIGFNGDIRGQETIQYDDGQILGSPDIYIDSENRITIKQLTVTKSATTKFDGYALIWPASAEDPFIIYDARKAIDADSNGQITIP
jgi:hypothetical protein